MQLKRVFNHQTSQVLSWIDKPKLFDYPKLQSFFYQFGKWVVIPSAFVIELIFFLFVNFCITAVNFSRFFLLICLKHLFASLLILGFVFGFSSYLKSNPNRLNSRRNSIVAKQKNTKLKREKKSSARRIERELE